MQQKFCPQVSYMTSNADDLVNLLSQQFQDNQQSSSSSSRGKKSGNANSGSQNSHWSADKLANLLNMEMDEADQVEGNFFLSMLSGDKFFAFDNHTVEQIPRRKLNSSIQNFNCTEVDLVIGAGGSRLDGVRYRISGFFF